MFVRITFLRNKNNCRSNIFHSALDINVEVFQSNTNENLFHEQYDMISSNFLTVHTIFNSSHALKIKFRYF